MARDLGCLAIDNTAIPVLSNQYSNQEVLRIVAEFFLLPSPFPSGQIFSLAMNLLGINTLNK